MPELHLHFPTLQRRSSPNLRGWGGPQPQLLYNKAAKHLKSCRVVAVGVVVAVVVGRGGGAWGPR